MTFHFSPVKFFYFTRRAVSYILAHDCYLLTTGSIPSDAGGPFLQTCIFCIVSSQHTQRVHTQTCICKLVRVDHSYIIVIIIQYYVFYCFISFSSFHMGWLCGVGVFGLIECSHSLPALHSGLQLIMIIMQ